MDTVMKCAHCADWIDDEAWFKRVDLGWVHLHCELLSRVDQDEEDEAHG